MNEYEMMTVFHPRLNADDAGVAVTALEAQVAAQGGEMLSTDVWGRRRLAYPIDGVTEGTYVLMTFNLPPTGTVPLERWMRISDTVLRHLLIRGIIPFEGGRDERDDRDDRYDRDDRDDRDGDRRDRDDDRDRREDDRPQAAVEAPAEAPAAAAEATPETPVSSDEAADASDVDAPEADTPGEAPSDAGDTPDEPGDDESET